VTVAVAEQTANPCADDSARDRAFDTLAAALALRVPRLGFVDGGGQRRLAGLRDGPVVAFVPIATRLLERLPAPAHDLERAQVLDSHGRCTDRDERGGAERAHGAT
jgi:hypothetical protein